MHYRLHVYLALLWRWVRKGALPAIIAATTLYFGLYAYYGPKGLRALDEADRQLRLERADLEILKEQHARQVRRERLLNGAAIDRDLLEEEARRVLNRAHPDEVVVIMPALITTTSGDGTSSQGAAN